MKKNNRWAGLAILLMAVVVACSVEPLATPEATEAQVGGNTTYTGTITPFVFQEPAVNLSASELAAHQAAGQVFYNPSVAIQQKTGPLFNQTACAACHTRNTKAVFPAINAGDMGGMAFYISNGEKGLNGEPLPVPNFGTVLQAKAIAGKTPETGFGLGVNFFLVGYVDSNYQQLATPLYSLKDTYKKFPLGTKASPRLAPAVYGLGLLENVTEKDIIANADENDANGDGISGRPNYVWDMKKRQTVLGRFGWKAGQPNLVQQAAADFSAHMGITSSLFPNETAKGQEQDDQLSDDPEINDATLASAAFYTQSLSVPTRREMNRPLILIGKKLFSDINCDKCHLAKLQSSPNATFPFLSNQTFYPYTDMLLHDMGEALSDGRVEFLANGNEWRTPPLWGIGLTKTVAGHSNLLHDGRARTIEEAIIWHGGEAQNAKDAFLNMSRPNREALIAFINTL